MATIFSKVFDTNQGQVKSTDKDLKKIKDLADKVSKMQFPEMQKRIAEMKAELKILVDKIPFENKLSLKKIDRVKALPLEEKAIQDKLMEFLPEVYTFIDEVYFRKIGSRFHDVQLRAAIILAKGQRLVELFTGEGKTRTFQLPLFLYSLAGRGAHLVTVNDYLSRRDGEYAGHIAEALGLSVGIITSNASYRFIKDEEIKIYKGEEGVKIRDAMKDIDISSMDTANLIECNKKEAYNCDLTYGTNNEFGFDYLRDNMAWDLNAIAQRELYFCIIDEADSILIDEARTPLIISGVPTDANIEKYEKFASAVKDLAEKKDYEIDHKTRTVTLTEEGIVNVENRLGVDNIWKDYSMAYHIENALKAQTMFNKDEHYLVKNGEVLIVDEFTGRILKGRRYSEGLHQAIEAKEGVQVQQESKTFATITFQNFFRLYKVLCGGSGTVMTEAEEFYKIYGLESVSIPTNRTVVRKDFADLIYRTEAGKFKAVVNEIKERHAKGQPILVGTTSVDKSEILSRMLDGEKIPHEVLNAKYHEQEAKIIEKAGRRGAVTVATNMAGRGADIIIGGGRRGDQAFNEIKELGGLHVMGTERHEARRIDNQLRGRTGRQGEPGSSRFYVSLEDQLIKILGGEMVGSLLGRIGMSDDMPVEVKIISRQIETAQKRIEGINFDSRKRIVDYDDVMNQHREIFYSRRRNFLEEAEEASGKFIVNGNLLDLNLPENQERKKDFDSKINEAKDKLKQSVERLIVRNLSDLINDKRQRNEKLTKEALKKVYEEITKIVPEEVLAKAYSLTSLNEIKTKLDTDLVKLKEAELKAYLTNLAGKIVEEKINEFGDTFFYLCKAITLQTMDNFWVEHLEFMKDIREGITLQAYAQKDPLVEYKNESFAIFESFIKAINIQIVRQLTGIKKIKQTVVNEQGAAFNVNDPIMQATKVTNQTNVEDVLTGSREFTDAEFIEESAEGANIQSANSLIKRINKERNLEEASVRSDKDVEGKRLGTKAFKQFNRNDKVTVQYMDGTIVRDVKFKKVEKDILDKKCSILE